MSNPGLRLIERIEEEQLQSGTEDQLSQNLKKLKESSRRLRDAKSKEIKFADPILKQGEYPVFDPRTINVIQGQAGVHKSRLAEYMCSALIKKAGFDKELLGLKRTNLNTYHKVIYADTERNLSDQFPFAIQSILTKAGYSITDDPSCFDFITLLEFSRKDRYSVLKDYIKDQKSSAGGTPLFIVLDVVTDCVEDFNRVDKSLELIDLLNQSVNEFDVTFLCLIHENPGSEKARGHLGSELMNKSSTFLKLGFEKDSSQNDTDLIKVKYLKLRSTKKPLPFYIKYCQIEKGLVLASLEDIQESENGRKYKGRLSEIIDLLEVVFSDTDSIFKTDLDKFFNEQIGISNKTLSDRLKEIIENKAPITDREGVECLLLSRLNDKKKEFYLEPIKDEAK